MGTKICDGSSQKLMFGSALSLLQSFKGGTNGFPESVVMLWDMGSAFYSKWVVMQWTHPSSLRATKCKVCQYAGRLWHLYSMLQLSELYSYFEIQKWMWSYVVTFCADCIRLLADSGMNICNEVWSLSTVMQPHTVCNKHKELQQSCYWNLKENQHMVLAWPTGLSFLGQWQNTWEVTNCTEWECRSLISAMTIVKTLPRWGKRVTVLSKNNDTSVK